jgi:hypothetical protein
MSMPEIVAEQATTKDKLVAKVSEISLSAILFTRKMLMVWK